MVLKSLVRPRSPAAVPPLLFASVSSVSGRGDTQGRRELQRYEPTVTSRVQGLVPGGRRSTGSGSQASSGESSRFLNGELGV